MKKGDLVKITGKTEWGKGRQKEYALLSGEPVVRVADIKESGNIRICDKDTPNTEEGLWNGWNLSSWVDEFDVDFEVIYQE